MQKQITMKKYAIIIDENHAKRVVPSNWLTTDKSTVLWPSDDTIDISKAIIDCVQSSPDWKKFKITKVIKYNDNYTNATEEMKLSRLEELSDPSDQEKLKKSRSKRSAKVDDDFVSNILKSKKTKKDSRSDKIAVDKNERISKGSTKESINETSNSESEHDTSDGENSQLFFGKIPNNLNVALSSSSTWANQRNSYNSNIAESTEKVANTSDPLELTTAEMFQQILAYQDKIYKKVHKIDIRQELLENNFNDLKQQALQKMELASLSDDDMKTINKSFPINTNPEDPEKKMEVVAEKLKKKKFAEMLFYKKVGNKFMRSHELQIERLKGLGGSSTRDATFKMMAFVASDDVYVKYSFKGQKSNQNGKNMSFRETLLCSCIYHALKKMFSDATDETIKNAMQKWLDQSKTRLLGKQGTSKRTSFQSLDLLVDDSD